MVYTNLSISSRLNLACSHLIRFPTHFVLKHSQPSDDFISKYFGLKFES